MSEADCAENAETVPLTGAVLADPPAGISERSRLPPPASLVTQSGRQEILILSVVSQPFG
ncbi:MAG TPA: hypothetical protein DC058_10485 [Planctomycetaceae bacterium]|nr:hypothetical protein [Planctomycetaceae bacterium]HBC61632.1 hypothetical protein [Planctomycetaceae bacterium]